MAEPLMRELAEGGSQWAIPWPCIYEFFGVVTHPRLFSPPSSSSVAIAQIEYWIASPSLVLLMESSQSWAALRNLLVTSAVIGPLVHDAKIANLCIENGIDELLTADRDFSRFPKLKTRNPFIAR